MTNEKPITRTKRNERSKDLNSDETKYFRQVENVAIDPHMPAYYRSHKMMRLHAVAMVCCNGVDEMLLSGINSNSFAFRLFLHETHSKIYVDYFFKFIEMKR